MLATASDDPPSDKETSRISLLDEAYIVFRIIDPVVGNQPAKYVSHFCLPCHL
jgi:hypothetical protein